MKGKIFDEYLLYSFSSKYSNAQGRKEKGQVVKWFMTQAGCSKGTAYNVLKRMSNDISIADIAGAKQQRKSRKNDIQKAIELRDTKRISAIKRRSGEDKKWIPTERAIEIAEDMGFIEKGKYTRSTMDRLLKKYGLNFKAAQFTKIAHEITTRHPMHVVAVDATPIDHYYMALDRSVARYNLAAGDKHIEDYLARDNRSKVWVYYAVDMYTRAWVAKPYASVPKGKNSKNPGENAEDWLDFLKFVFLPKHNLESPLEGRRAPFEDCPLEGLPLILFCDRGSGIGRSTLVNRVCSRLGINVATHFPGYSSAKGVVESRIGAFKRSFECQINPEVIKNIDQLFYFYTSWAEYHNEDRGFYAKFQKESIKYPIRRVTEKNLQDVVVSHAIRTIDGYGCVSIDGQDWFVTYDPKYKKEKVKVFRVPSLEDPHEFVYKVETSDKVIHTCSEGRQQMDFEEWRKNLFPVTQEEKHRKEAEKLSKTIARMQDFDDILPRDNKNAAKLHRLPARTTGKEIETHSPLVQENFPTVKQAWSWLLNQSGLFVEQIPEPEYNTINNAFLLIYEKEGIVPGALAESLSNLLNSKLKRRSANE